MSENTHFRFQNPDAPRPLVTVIIPEALEDPRRNPDYLASWTHGQLGEGLNYEVIVALKEGDNEIERGYRSQLRDEDRLIKGGFKSPIACYSAAVSVARGDFFLFTENHTKALPDCLAKLSHSLQSAEFKAASLRSEFENHGLMDVLEEGLYRDYHRKKWSLDGEWDCVRLRGFVIERELYLSIGGMPDGLGLFAEEYLSAKLSVAGVEVGYIQEAAITHVNVGSFPHLRHDIEDFTEGECLYWDSLYEPSLRPFFGEPRPWRQRAFHLPGIRKKLAPALFLVAKESLRRGDAGFAFKTYAQAVKQLYIDQIGEEEWVGLAELAVQAQKVFAYSFFWNRLGLAAFEKMWRAVRNVTRLKHFARYPEPQGYELPAWESFNEAEPPQIGCFHEKEEADGREFRWSEPLATIRLNLENREHFCRIDTGGIRGNEGDFPFGIVFNGHLVEELSFSEGVIGFTIPADWIFEGEQLLVLVMEPFEAGAAETRRLGLPVFDLEVKHLRRDE